MSGQNWVLTTQILGLPDTLSGPLLTRPEEFKFLTIASQLQLLKFDWPKMGHIQAKTCLTGQSGQCLPASYLQPCSYDSSSCDISLGMVIVADKPAALASKKPFASILNQVFWC